MSSQCLLYLLSHYIMVNHLTEIKQNFILLNPQKQNGKFLKKLLLYLSGAEEGTRTQFSSYLPDMPGMMLLLLLLCPQIAHSVAYMNIFLIAVRELQWKNELNHTAESIQIQKTLNTLSQSLNGQGASLDCCVFDYSKNKCLAFNLLNLLAF